VSPREAFPGYDEAANVDVEPEEAVRRTHYRLVVRGAGSSRFGA
jgi:hypothetical protein